MTRAFVLMTAMPPTVGHMNLVRFAASLPVEQTRVIVCTQPGEPFTEERYKAVRDAAMKMHSVVAIQQHRTIEQDPKAPGFWEMWDKNMTDYGMKPGDYFVSSEPYGATVAERMGGVFIPYDPKRELHPCKGTAVRYDPDENWEHIIPEFRKYLAVRVTVFGAESTGKTTLSKELARFLKGNWLFEWARPYLETVGKEITREKMMLIWEGQRATQKHLPMTNQFIIQDTDLYSTIGYWEQAHWAEALGECPRGLYADARNNKSDLYLITKSNIPFEPDDIRYGIDKRESPDEYWIALAEREGLNYVVIDSDSKWERLDQAADAVLEFFAKRIAALQYDRKGL